MNSESELPIEEISVEELNAIVHDNVLLLDVREEYEFYELRAAGAKLIPLDQIPNASDSLPEEQTIYIICASGNRSMVACEYLSAKGFTTVNVIGGTIAWNAAGYAVNRGQASESEIFRPV